MADVDFRDGTREVPDYLVRLMADLDTHTLTYQQAVEAASSSLVRRRLNDAQSAIIAAHFQRKQP